MTRFRYIFDRHLRCFFVSMTKIITVLRHAQSAGKQSGQHDYDRPLTPAGENSVRILGKNLSHLGFRPDLILSSSSNRTRQTAEILNEFLGLGTDKITFKKELYEGMTFDWQENIRGLSNGIQHVMLIGHNPWLSVLASGFTDNLIDLGACALASFEFECNSWTEGCINGKEILNIKPSEHDHG